MQEYNTAADILQTIGPRKVIQLYAYVFLPVDDYRCLSELPPAVLDASVFRGVRAAAKTCGWEGDGDWCVWWCPPFLVGDDGDGGGVCEPYLFVKQSNNGTSFLVGRQRLRLNPKSSCWSGKCVLIEDGAVQYAYDLVSE